MDEYLLKTIKALVDYGATLVIAAITIGMVVKYFSAKMPGASKSQVCQIDICSHSLFADLDYLVGIIVPRTIFGSSSGRNKLFRVMMNDVLYVCRDRCLQFAKRFREFESEEAWVQANTDLLVSIVKSYTDLWIEHGIPQDAIDIFVRWNSTRISLIQNEIKMISTSALYETYAEKQASLFEIYRLIMRITMHDGEQTLGVLNGSLSGKVFQGEVI